MQPHPHIPTHTGLAALEELGQVAWEDLDHAYGRGVTGKGLHDDVAGSLRLLATDPEAAISDGLYSNICHQGTVYEATAYAVPFLAAIAAGDVEPSLRRQLVGVLATIALGASFVAESGSHSGAHGEGVDELVPATLARCEPLFSKIAEADDTRADLLEAISALVAHADDETRDELAARLEESSQDDDD